MSKVEINWSDFDPESREETEQTKASWDYLNWCIENYGEERGNLMFTEHTGLGLMDLLLQDDKEDGGE